MPNPTRADLLEANEELLAQQEDILDVLEDPDLDSDGKLELIGLLLDEDEEEVEE